jgi:hypothetical protein
LSQGLRRSSESGEDEVSGAGATLGRVVPVDCAGFFLGSTVAGRGRRAAVRELTFEVRFGRDARWLFFSAASDSSTITGETRGSALETWGAVDAWPRASPGSTDTSGLG